MAEKKHRFSKREALYIVLLCAAVLVVMIIVRSCGSKQLDCSTRAGREQFLAQYGWKIDPDSEDHKSVIIPDSLDGIIDNYNEMQQEQGFDLSKHLGERCEQYSYTVTNYPGSEQTVLVTIYVQGQRAIAGDVHSTALNGFMHGLEQK